MKMLKSHIQLAALVLSFVFANTVLATESTTNESKDSGNAGSDTASPVAQNTDSKTASSVAQAATTVSDQQASQAQTINDTQSYRKQMDERRQQAQVAQQEAYERFLERRKQNTAAFNSNIPADVKERHNEFIKQMEQRRALNINESKDIKAANAVSGADSNTASPVAKNADSEAASPAAQADTVASIQQASQPQTISDDQSYRKQMDERRQQAQVAQQEAYERLLERRNQNTAAFNSNIPADVQERRNAFIKQMEQRRALNIKMMEQHRKAAEERRAEMQLKMHRTSARPELAEKA